jgi:ABC-type Fe3+/spermidine/putrescine transport system ATPase subunit
MMIAGFVYPTRGQIFVDGAPVAALPPQKRDLGMVFQNYAVFPHLTVFQNIAFPLQIRRVPAAEVRRRVGEALELVRLQGYDRRLPRQLSGGEQQRVALARALVFRPRVLLMDEPLGALDKKLRAHMQLELKHIQQQLAVTVVYVTHDQEEALTMSDRVAVMNAGRIIQEGTPVEIYKKPSDPFVARFIGLANFLEGRALETVSGGFGLVQTAIGILRCHFVRPASLDEKTVVMIRPEDVALIQGTNEALQNVVDGKIEVLVFTGEAMDCRVKVLGHELRLKLSSSTPLQPSSPVRLYFPAERCLAIQNSGT